MSYRDLIKHKRETGTRKGTQRGTPKYTPEEFEQLVDGYIEECDSHPSGPVIPTINHFAMIIKISREQLYKFYREADEYKNSYAALQQGRDGMTEYYLVNPDESRKGSNLIFAAKNYLGMSDKQEIEHSEKVVDTGEHEW